LRPARDEIEDAAEHFKEVLAIRASSRLFRLRTADEVRGHLDFRNAGPDQIPGLIVMVLSDNEGALDHRYRQIVALFNAKDAEQEFADPSLAGRNFHLHPLQAASHDPVVRAARFDPSGGSFTVPGRTAAVFVARGAEEDEDE
jgi:hypothetical protein